MKTASKLASKEKTVQAAGSTPKRSRPGPVLPRGLHGELLALQQRIGNRAVGQAIRSGAIQAKLRIGEPNDQYEQEADRVAEQVTRIPEQYSGQQEAAELAPGQTVRSLAPLTSDYQLRRTREAPSKSPSPYSGILEAGGSGDPLTGGIRTYYERFFGCDLGAVRLHSGPDVDVLGRRLNARAFAVGRDVFLRGGQYDHKDQSNRELLAHELTHVFQQEHSPRLQLWRERVSTQWAGGSGGMTDDDSYVEILAEGWGRRLSSGEWDYSEYPSSYEMEMGDPFSQWDRVGTYLRIRDHRDFSWRDLENVDEYWTVWVYWPIADNREFGDGTVEVRGPGTHAVVEAVPSKDAASRRLNTRLVIRNALQQTSGVSIVVEGAETISGGNLVRTYILNYDAPTPVTEHEIVEFPVYFPENRGDVSEEMMRSIHRWLTQTLDPSTYEELRAGSIEINVEAFASTSNSVDYNQRLSRRRRDNVVTILRDFLGQDADIDATAEGELAALEQGVPDESEDREWRVARIWF